MVVWCGRCWKRWWAVGDKLLSVGLDVGTTSTQLVVSALEIENQASSFTVPELAIGNRQVLYESPVYFTPLVGQDRVDGQGIRDIVEREYARAGIRREQVDTGAVIITGETSRKENARAVLEALAEFAGDFVVATAGPDLESVLAARGAGAVDYSREAGSRVLHMDIGGGTANLALIEDGKILKTGCLNVGGRLVKYEGNGRLAYISPVLAGLWGANVGDPVTAAALEALAQTLVQALEMAAGLRKRTALLERLWTREAGEPWQAPGGCAVSFSGGVADCILEEKPWDVYGDLGPALGQAIRASKLCAGEYRLGAQTIRATVIGAGCHSAQLSGSTVFYRNVTFPLKNLRAVTMDAPPPEDTGWVLHLPEVVAPGHGAVCALAEGIVQWSGGAGVYVCARQDMAKALGQALALRLPAGTPILCLDRIQLSQESFLDVAAPVGPAVPVVVKTLVLKG